MRKAFFILVSIVISGCATTPVVTLDEHKVVKNPVQKTSIFYYYLDPVNPTQAASVVRGNFLWKENCLYLIDGEHKVYTAVFPEFPKGIVNWDEVTKTIELNGRVFKMGDYIYTNGSYQSYTPNTVGGIEYEKQGDKKCLTPSIVKIGTFFD